jgi:hypothetical protein
MSISPVVGQKLSGNGDILSFGYNCDEIINGIGRDSVCCAPCGPTITGIIDNRGSKVSPNILDAHIIQEGTIPQALAPVIQSLLESIPGKVYPKPFLFKARARQFWSSMKIRIFGPYVIGGSVNRTQTYLVMSHDNNEGILSMEHDKLRLQFLGVGKTEHVKKLERMLEKLTNSIGGTLINSPFYAGMIGKVFNLYAVLTHLIAFNQHTETTVHPLGGAVMSSDNTGAHGTTNHLGQVLKGKGDEVYDDLICIDGSIIPTALGKKPILHSNLALTITLLKA